MEVADLYHQYGPGLWSYLLRRARQPEDAQELFQEIFVAAVQNPAAIQAARSKKAWLVGIARNLLRNHYRRSALRKMNPLPDDAVARDEAVDSRKDLLHQALERVPDAQREVLELKIRDEMTYAEIAEALEIPIGTVRSRLHSAVSNLRALIKPTNAEVKS